MIKKSMLSRKGKAALKAATVFLTAVSLVSLAQLSACAATNWTFWGDYEETSEEAENVCVTTLYKGQTEQFLDMGEEVAGEITWSVDKPEILDISEEGELIPLKVGNTMVTVVVKTELVPAVTSGSIRFDYVSEPEYEENCYQYYISVCKKKAYKAVKKAQGALGSAYSQAKRMKKGFYDCSSLIWRSYSPYGILFGEETWAPTAADQALWCDENGKSVSISAASLSDGKLLPGDLVFYSKNTDNGRYKKIYHVAMFEGYEMEYNEETGEAELSATVIEADGDSVVRNAYRSEFLGTSGKKIAVLARPAK